MIKNYFMRNFREAPAATRVFEFGPKTPGTLYVPASRTTGPISTPIPAVKLNFSLPPYLVPTLSESCFSGFNSKPNATAGFVVPPHEFVNPC